MLFSHFFAVPQKVMWRPLRSSFWGTTKSVKIKIYVNIYFNTTFWNARGCQPLFQAVERNYYNLHAFSNDLVSVFLSIKKFEIPPYNLFTVSLPVHVAPYLDDYKCLQSEFFWSFFPCIRTEYEILCISPIQTKCGNIRTRKTTNTDIFYAVNAR